jgi:hypothetical protein
VGVQQMQVVWGNGDWWWGDVKTCQDPHSSTRLSFERLKRLDYNNTSRSPGYWAQTLQRSAYPTRYDERMGEAQRYYDRLAGSAGNTPQVPSSVTPEPGFTGDPLWLADVLRAEGLKVVELDGWKTRGQGDQYKLWGIICHHTGGNNSPVSEIAFHRQLGLAAQIHLAKDGTVTVCGVGKANHAGAGDYPGLPSDNANPYTIGIEAVNLPPKNGAHRESWPNAQYDAYVKCCAAICRKLAVRADRVISHKEWAGRKQGKWDPGSIDMNIFRADVQARIDSFNPLNQEDDLTPEQDKMLREVHAWLGDLDASDSIYATPGEGKRWPLRTMMKHNNKFLHEEYVERTAQLGDPDSLDRLFRVAAGQGVVKTPEVVARAKAALEMVPDDVIEAFKDSRG